MSLCARMLCHIDVHMCMNIITSPAGRFAKYCDKYVSVCVCPRVYLRNHTRSLYQIFLCLLPMSVARSSSGTLSIGCIACRREGGDGSAQRGRSVIYDCLVFNCVSPTCSTNRSKRKREERKKQNVNYLTTDLGHRSHIFYCIICTYATQYTVDDTEFFSKVRLHNGNNLLCR